jgi:hypothetical protein
VISAPLLLNVVAAMSWLKLANLPTSESVSLPGAAICALKSASVSAP